MSLVSVVIPARNAATTIGRTLASLTEDAESIGEIIVVDDASTDLTADRARQIGQQLGLPVNVHKVSFSSAGASRNHGIQNAKFPFLYFIDADDVLLAGKLTLMASQFAKHPQAQLVIGASVRVTPGRKEIVRFPTGYTDNPIQNCEMYLRNGSPPIAIGSGLVHKDAVKTVRFPETITIDEDTWFWSAVIVQSKIIVLDDIIVGYYLDLQRTAKRFCVSPRKDWLAIVREFEHFRKLGVSKEVLDYRKAWLAQRFARQLIKDGRYNEARRMLRPVVAHPSLRSEMRTRRYRLISGVGQKLGSVKKDHETKANTNGVVRTMIITHDPAWPPVSGADLRNYQNAHMALRRGPVVMASINEYGADENPEGVGLVSLTRSGDPKVRSINPNRFTNEPRISTRALDRLRDSVLTFNPDVVIVEGVFLHSLIPHLYRGKHHLIVDMHNVESSLARWLNVDSRPTLSRRYSDRKMRRAETKAIRQADRVWVCTDEDRSKIIDSDGIGTPIHVVPNGIPWKANRSHEGLQKMRDIGNSPNLLFVGHLGYLPNVEAVDRLAKDVFPAVRDAFPEASLHIVGRHPKAQVRALAKLPGIELFETPEDVAPYLRRADITVIPLEKGGGSRIKILEAASFGVPVVATTVAAEGLVFNRGTEIIIANSTEKMIDETINLLRDCNRREEIRASAFEAVQCLYGDASISGFTDEGLGL